MLPENISQKKLILITGVFIIVILVGFFSLRKPALSFTLTPESAIEQMLAGSAQLSPEKALLIVQKQDAGYLFIDTRDPYEFVKGHIKGAGNIPVQELLDKKNLKTFTSSLEDSVKIVLYGNDESSVNGAVQILRQSGYINLLALQGGYTAYKRKQDGVKADSIPREQSEARWYDYTSYLKTGATSVANMKAETQAKTAAPKKITPKPSKSSGEGC
ncbi:MAG: rhodanese-like domain-containing protein [Bacteroidales bacterium]